MNTISSLVRNSVTHPKVFDLNSGRVSTSEMHSSIQQCLRLLIQTTRGELLGDPDFGTNLVSYLFDPNVEDLITEIKEDILSAVDKYEKRVQMSLDDIQIDTDDTKVYINISYKIIMTNETRSFQLSVLR